MVATIVAVSVASPGPALADSAPSWAVSSVAEPTNFSFADNAKCSALGYSFCDSYLVTVTNIGGRESEGQIRIADTLPPGLRLKHMYGENLATEAKFSCRVGEAVCPYEGKVTPGRTIIVVAEVEVEALSAVRVVSNVVTVEGGGARPVVTTEPLTMSNTVGGSAAGFGISDFGMRASDSGGAVDGQAADHPYDLMTLANINTVPETKPTGEIVLESSQQMRDVAVLLPLGLVGDPLAAGTCTALQLFGRGENATVCPAASRVGTASVFSGGRELATVAVSDVYNMTPEKGYPAHLAFKVDHQPVPLYASVVHTSSGYAVRVATPGIPRTLTVEGFGLTLFGDPNLADSEPNNPQAFFTNPSDCSAEPLTTKLEIDSWAEPGNWSSAQSVVYPHITGCDLLQFEPTVEMRPEVTEAEAPSGFEIKIKAPQNPNQFPILATPDLKNVTMTLPEGMTLAPGAADGLQACDATGSHGINMPGSPLHPNEVVSEGEEIGPDGITHLVPGHCPLASQIGTVEVATPVLKEPLEGHVYVGSPLCGGEGQPECTPADAGNGRLYRIYLEVEGSGVVIKLGGQVSADPTTGRLTARFTELPQQPIGEVSLRLKGGQRAPLANPRQCGPAVTNAEITPWGAPAVPDALLSPSFPVDWDGNGAPCPATLPFAPTLTAGSLSAAAGRFSPVSLTVQRGDRMKDISRLQVKLPPGLLGMLSSVTLCGEPQASLGTCAEASEIGRVSVAVGSGPHPFVVTGGRVYLTEGYRGAPFGLAIVVPAKAGPFNLGNVIERAAISIDSETDAVTVTTDPLQQFLDGIPLRIQTINTTIERPGGAPFTFNPTNCGHLQIAASIEAEQGGSVNVASPFAVEGCRNLPFAPTFAASTQAKTSRAKGASLHVKVTSAFGQDNIGRALVSLPKQLPARLTTLQQACPEATFAQNPALCPAASAVGSARAITPLLSAPLTGPAYLESHGGAAFPDLVVILQGQGVRLDLRGNTSIAKGITTSTFAAVPDAPVSSFELTLPEGAHSALAGNLPAKAKGNLCGTKLLMPTTLTAQDGAQLKQSTRIAVLGCPKGHPPKAKKARARARR